MQKLHLKLKKAKIEGITVKWLFNVLGVIALIFIAVFVAACFSLKSFYYSGVENVISAGVSTVADNYFSIYEDSGAAFKTTAANFIEDYPYKDRTTVWVIDADGSVVSSSSGFVIDEQDMPDYDEALTASDSTATWTGRLASGEKAMAICRILYDADSNQIGAVRVLASLEQVDKQISTICLFLALILLAFFGLIVFSNVYFIRSIIIPVQQISETTKLIAKGNLGARIEYKSDDEIGELCTSINRMAEEIAASDKMKNDFISTISHELRTPLTSIKGWAETLKFDNTNSQDELTKRGLQVIVSESARLEGFVEELLDFSRLQSGRMNLRLERCDIIAELNETIFTFVERAHREGIDVKYSVPKDCAPSNADPNRLKQVFMNILDNALKYSRPGSRIFVKAVISDQDTDVAPRCLKIMFVDEGCGISAEDLPHVKEKFYKANVSVRGSGIGLAVTNEIVTLHGGRLDIDSVEGRGTMVTVYLPLDNFPPSS